MNASDEHSDETEGRPMIEEQTETTSETETTDAPENFDRSYVEKLRAENAEHRTARREAEERLAARDAALLAARVENAARTVLADPSDLLRYVEAGDLVDDEGAPDTEKIKSAATRLVEQKPHLAARLVGGDVGQGPRGAPTPPVFDFADVLRKTAR